MSEHPTENQEQGHPVPEDYKEPAAETTGEVPPPPEEKAADEAPPPPKPIPVSGTVTLEFPITSPFTEKEAANFRDLEAIYTFQITQPEIRELEDVYSFKKRIGNTEESRQWFNAFTNSLSSVVNGGTFQQALSRKGSNWNQGAMYGGRRIGLSAPEVGEDNMRAGLKPGAAIQLVRSAMGFGGTVQVPLLHSGIWVSLETPSDGELLNLDELIGNEKITLGRDSSGFLFSNSMVYTAELVYDFIVTKMISSSVATNDPTELKSLIKIQDLPILVWAMSFLIYPKGFPLDRPCINNPLNCQHVFRVLLNLSKMLIVDWTGISQEQCRFMAARSEKRTIEQIVKYQEQFDYSHGLVEKLNGNISVKYRGPSVGEYFDAGRIWINEMIQMANKVVSMDAEPKVRDAMIRQHSVLTAVRQYAHYVEYFIINPDSENPIILTDPETLTDTMNELSRDDDILKKFMEGVTKFIDMSTIALIGIDRESCPKCGDPQTAITRKHSYIIPIEPFDLFFALSGRKLTRLRTN